MISCARRKTRHAWRNAATLSLLSGVRTFMRLVDARLQLVASRNMNSEHGFDALIRPELGTVCHLLIVVSNCIPGSAQRQAACDTFLRRSRAGRVRATAPFVRHRVLHSRF